MMAEQLSGQEAFLALLWNQYGQVSSDDSLKKARAKAWDHFLELGLPKKENEVFKYLRLRNFFSQNYEPSHPTELTYEAISSYVLPECHDSVAVFVNGYFSPSLSRLSALPKGATALSTLEAMQVYGGFLTGQWTKMLKEETDPFAAINMALHKEGLFLYVTPQTQVIKPIQILSIIDVNASPMCILPRFQSFVGARSEVSIVVTQVLLSGTSYTVNMSTELAIEEDAHVKYTQIYWDQPDTVWTFDAFRASLKRNSTLKTVLVTDGAGTVRNDYRVLLVGENAEASLNGVGMLKGRKEAHVHVLMDHQAPYCRSNQLFKEALNDSTKSSFEGKILVRQLAQKTEAFQLNNNLLLSNGAHADSKPNLEIFADDVKASHGSTVGQLDKEQVFYMKTRGFSDAMAKNLLVYGFCQEVVDLISIPSLYDKMKVKAQTYLLG